MSAIQQDPWLPISNLFQLIMILFHIWITMKAGRFFSRDYGMDTASFVINESSAKALGWTNQEAIGKDFKYGNQKGHIIGVINDFHFESMHQTIVPMILCYFPPSQILF